MAIKTMSMSTGNGQYNATMSIPQTGSWYWEVTRENDNGTGVIGISNPDLSLRSSNANGVGAFSWYIGGPRKQTNGVEADYGSSVSQGDVVGVAFACPTAHVIVGTFAS